MREREGLGFTEGDRVGQKNLCGRGGPLIKFTAPGFKGVKVKTPFRRDWPPDDGCRDPREQIPPCDFDRWKQKFTLQQSKIPMTTIVRRYKHLGLNINVLDHFTWGGSSRLSSMNLG